MWFRSDLKHLLAFDGTATQEIAYLNDITTANITLA